MNVIQRTNKFARTTFSRVGIGHPFSLAPGGTPLTKIDNNFYAVIAPATGPDNVRGLLLPTGVVPYYVPAFNNISDGTVVYDPNPNPTSLGSYFVPGDSQVILVDPPFYNGLSSYLMDAEFDPATGIVNLSWTYPNMRLGFPTGPGQAGMHVTNIVIQRSTSTRATPFGPTGDGPVNAFYNVSQYNDVIADPAWETLLNETSSYTVNGPPPYPLTDSFSDTPPITSSNHIFHYRLIVFIRVNPFMTPLQIPYEIEWNSVTLISPYSVTVDTSGNQPRLRWTLPNASELASLSGFFLNSFNADLSTTPLAITTSGFTMPAADNNTQTSLVTIDRSNSFIANNGDYFHMADVGAVRLVKFGSGITVINAGLSGNASPGSSIPNGKAITPVTQLSWVFDWVSNPTDYSLQKSYNGTDYATVATLPVDFVQPFYDAEPPSPTIYYRLVANFSSGGSIPYPFGLTYTVGSVSA